MSAGPSIPAVVTPSCPIDTVRVPQVLEELELRAPSVHASEERIAPEPRQIDDAGRKRALARGVPDPDGHEAGVGRPSGELCELGGRRVAMRVVHAVADPEEDLLPIARAREPPIGPVDDRPWDGRVPEERRPDLPSSEDRIGREGACHEIGRLLRRARPRAIRLQARAEAGVVEKPLGLRGRGPCGLDLDRDAREQPGRRDVPPLAEREATVRVECVGVIPVLDDPSRGAGRGLCLRRGRGSRAGERRARRVPLQLGGPRCRDAGRRFRDRDEPGNAPPAVVACIRRRRALRAQGELPCPVARVFRAPGVRPRGRCKRTRPRDGCVGAIERGERALGQVDRLLEPPSMDLALPRLVESRRLPERVVEALSRLAPDRLPVRPGRTLRLDTGRSSRGAAALVPLAHVRRALHVPA